MNLVSVIKMTGKKRKYLDDYIRYGFASLKKVTRKSPNVRCVTRLQSLNNDAIRPNYLKWHLTTAHLTVAKKLKAFFVMKSNFSKKTELGIRGTFQQNSSNVIEAP